MSSNAHTFTAVDIGTSKIVVLVAELSGDHSLEIIGLGSATSAGLVKGRVHRFREASDAVHRALVDAERSSRVNLRDVFLAQSGGHLDGFYNEASINVSSASNMVSAEDMERVSENARARHVPEDRVIIHQLPRPYRLDGKSVPDPENLVGRRLDVGYWTLHGQHNLVQDHFHLLGGFNLQVSELVHAGLASGTVVTTPEERQQGVIVLDIGEGATDYVLYREGCPHVVGTLAVGGGHVTNDLALGLRLNQGQAEKIKHEHGRAVIAAKDKQEYLWLNGTFEIGDRKLNRHAIETITSARMFELFEVVKKQVDTAFSPELFPAGVILTGGGSLLPGSDEAASRIFGLPARLGECTVSVKSPLGDAFHSTALGLLHAGLAQSARSSHRRRKTIGSMLKKLFN